MVLLINHLWCFESFSTHRCIASKDRDQLFYLLNPLISMLHFPSLLRIDTFFPVPSMLPCPLPVLLHHGVLPFYYNLHFLSVTIFDPVLTVQTI
jgi:hypothetical protein